MYEFVFAKFGEFVAVGGSAAAMAYAIYSFLGKNWIENKFSEQLEDHKHRNQQALEQFKHSIFVESERATKVYELELEVLPEAWGRLYRSCEALEIFVSPLKLESDVAGMDLEKYRNFLTASGVEHTKEVLSWIGEARVKGFRKIRFFHEYGEAVNAFKNFHEYVEEKSVFLSADIRDKFRALDKEISYAIIDKETGTQYNNIEMERDSFKAIGEKIQPIRSELEVLIQNRLRLLEKS